MSTVTLDIVKVKEAAATSPEARRALEVLCPEAFKPQRVPLGMDRDDAEASELEALFRDAGWGEMTVRRYGSHQGQGLWLNHDFDWAIEKDDHDQSVLVAYRKESK